MQSSGSPREVWTSLVSLAAYIASIANALAPVVLLQSATANYLFLGAAQLLPFGVLLRARRMHGVPRVLVVGAALVLALVAVPVFLGSLACASFSIAGDPSFERVSSAATPRGTVVLYRTNGGATTSFGIVARQQCSVLPGVLVVRRLGSEGHAYDATVELVDGDRVRIAIPAYGEWPATSFTSTLAKLPCWWSLSG